MTPLPLWITDALPPFLGALAMVVVGIITGRTNLLGKRVEVTTKRVEGATPSYEALDERVVKLETQVGELRSKVEHLQDENLELRSFARSQYTFIEQNVLPEVPRPFGLPPWLDRRDQDHNSPSSDSLETRQKGILQNGV